MGHHLLQEFPIFPAINPSAKYSIRTADPGPLPSVLVEGLQVLQEGAPVEDLFRRVPIRFLLQQNIHSLSGTAF